MASNVLLQTFMTVRLIEHTADMGIHVEAGDLNSLFEQAGEGLFMVIVGDQIEGDGDQTVTIQLQENQFFRDRCRQHVCP